MALDTLGSVTLFSAGDSKQAMGYFKEPEHVAEEFLKGTKKQASVLSSSSIAYALSGATDQAISSAEQALALQRANRSRQFDRLDRATESTLLIDLAELLISQGQFERAETCLHQAETLAPQDDSALSIPVGIAEARARAFCLTGCFSKAERLLRENIAKIEAAGCNAGARAGHCACRGIGSCRREVAKAPVRPSDRTDCRPVAEEGRALGARAPRPALSGPVRSAQRRLGPLP
jgi:tetratricopeptide (TPR) repeat protein